MSDRLSLLLSVFSSFFNSTAWPNTSGSSDSTRPEDKQTISLENVQVGEKILHLETGTTSAAQGPFHWISMGNLYEDVCENWPNVKRDPDKCINRFLSTWELKDDASSMY